MKNAMKKVLTETVYTRNINLEISSNFEGHEITISESETGDSKIFRFGWLDEDGKEIKRQISLYICDWIETNEEWLREDLIDAQKGE